MANKTVKKSNKEMFIKTLKAIGGILPVEAEDAKSAIDFTVETYEANHRDITLEDIKDTYNVIENSTGKTVKEWGVEYKKSISDSKNTVEVKEEKTEKKVAPKKETVENSVKLKPKAKKTEKVEEVEPKATEKIEDKEVPAPTEKKEKDVLLKSFPKELTSKALDGATLKLRTDIKNSTELADLISNKVDLLIAVYWNKRQLKQFKEGYNPLGINIEGVPSSFEHDLDLIEVTFAHTHVVSGHSVYTVVPYTFKGDEFLQDEDELRFANGMEFQIYEVIETN